MCNARHRGFPVLVPSLLYLSFLVSGLPGYVHAQEAPGVGNTTRGIDLYQQGDAAGTIKILKEVVKKHPEDADAWYYLGLAFNSQGMIGQARPQFEHLIQLRPESADAHAKLAYALIVADQPQKAMTMAQRAIELGDQSPEDRYALAEASFRMASAEKAVEEADAALIMNPDFLPALITKSLAHFTLKQYTEAAGSLEKFLAKSPDNFDADTWREQLKVMQEQAAAASTTIQPAVETTTFNAKTVTQKARVLSKPEPQYTEAARLAGVEGTIVIRGIFSSDGEVRHLIVTRALGYGLTTAAIRAAHQIKFQPAMKDDRPVSMYIQLEYQFHLF